MIRPRPRIFSPGPNPWPPRRNSRAPSSITGAGCYLAQGDTGQALEMFTQALKTDRSILDRAAMAADLFYLGEVYQTRGDLAQAWDNYVRAFDVYAGLGKKAQLSRCLKRLQEVNREGRLGHSLERFEKQAQPSPS